MSKEERKQARYGRRMAQRMERRIARSRAVGGVEEVFNLFDMYECGKACCNGVRWKASVQRYEKGLFMETAHLRRLVIDGEWMPSKYNTFTLTERGKMRRIDAPKIVDRQVHKTYTRNVLLKIYPASMINDNGASLKGKGFDFSIETFKEQLRGFFREYGREGYVILLDFEKFFPNAPHELIKRRHADLILDDDLRAIGDLIVTANGNTRGLPLGVEVSQIEMIAMPSALDNHIRCQMRLKYSGHYMDDYHILVPAGTDVNAVIDEIIVYAAAMGLTINKGKTKVVPLSKPFKFCKATYRLTETGSIITKGSPRSFRTARRKMKMFPRKLAAGTMTLDNARDAVQSVIAYFKKYGRGNHTRVLRLRRMYHTLIGGDIA